MVKEIFFCTIGSAFFAITMNIPRYCLKYAFIGAFITATTERLLADFYGELISCMMAMICLSFFSEAVARIVKVPTTIIVLPSTIPLLPGSAIYYSMLYGIGGNSQLFTYYLKSTIFTGLGIALGTIVSHIFINITNKKNQR